MPTDMTTVARALNGVQSAGQARAAIAAAAAELERGNAMVPDLSAWGTPDPGQAYTEVGLIRAQLAGEGRAYDSQADDSPLDADTWARSRRAIERTYVEVAGIEGVVGAVAAIDTGQILLDAVANAPKVFGTAVGDVLGAAGSAAGKAGAGLLGGLGFVGVAVLVVVLVIVLRGRLI
jgi:hypothetical protein